MESVCDNHLRITMLILQTWLADIQQTFIHNPSPDDKILGRSKLKQIADDILNEKKKKKVPYRVENIVRKGEMACYKQFRPG